MAGERYAHLEINSITPVPGNEISIWLAGAYQRFVASAARFPTGPEEYYCNGTYLTSAERYDNAVMLYSAIQTRLIALGADTKYVATVERNAFTQNGVITLVATEYDPIWNFQPTLSPQLGQVYAESLREDSIQPITLTYEVDIARCFSSLTAAIDLTVTGGNTSNYTYVWADGPTTQDRTNIGAGSYSVTVTEASGASASVTIQVGQNTQIVLEMVKTTTTLTVVASGGVAPYTYAWDDGPTTAERLDVEPGYYRCVVRDSLGCGAAVDTTFEPSRFYFSHDPIVLALDAGDDYRDDPTTKPDLSFVVDVFIERDYLSGVFEQAGQAEEQPADRDGRTVFEVQELLEPYVSPTLPSLKAGEQYQIAPASQNFLRFYLRHRERYGGVLAGTLTTERSYLVYGGLSFEEAARATFFNGWFTQQKPFLTWEPRRKKVTRTQPEYLYYPVNSATTTTINRKVRVYLDDTTSEVRTVGSYAGVLQFEVYLLPVSFAALGLATYEAGVRRVLRYDVYVTDQDDAVVSEVRTYVLDSRYYHTPRYFLYANSLGGFNTLAAHGRATLQLATKTTSTPLPRVAGYDPVRGDVEVDRITGLPTLKVATAARSAEQTLADQDFALSPRVLFYAGDRLRAGTVKDRTSTPLDEDATRRVLQFDFELPRERHYTPRLEVSAATISLPPLLDEV